MTDEENLENNSEQNITEEWVDENVIGDTGSTDDSVTDCCCDKRVTIDNGNWCIKLPRRPMTVTESIEFLNIIEDICDDNLPHFEYNYDGYNQLKDSIHLYKKNALQILDDNECITFNGDVSYHGDKI